MLFLELFYFFEIRANMDNLYGQREHGAEFIALVKAQPGKRKPKYTMLHSSLYYYVMV
jgi:hypothetical protein